MKALSSSFPGLAQRAEDLGPMHFVLCILFCALLWSCAPSSITVERPEPIPVVPSTTDVSQEDEVLSGEEVYARARGFFNAKAYSRAISAYNEYVARYPDGPHVEKSLMTVGTILARLGRHEEARNAYHRLIMDYPDSRVVAEAQTAIIRSHHDEGNHENLLRELAAMEERGLSTKHSLEINRLRAEAHAALDNKIEAAYYFTAAVKSAVGPMRNELYATIKATIDSMTIEEMEALKIRLKDAFPKDYLLLRLGEKYRRGQQYEETHSVLTDFTHKFPDHENSDWAIRQLADIERHVSYDRYKIGCLLPLTGPYKNYGSRAIKGLELALNRFYAQSPKGQRTPSVSIMVRDTGSHPEKTAAAVRELIDARVAAIIGPMIAVEPGAEEAQKNAIPIITITQKDGINLIGDYVFRNFITPEMQVEAVVSFAVEKLEARRFAVLYPREKYGKTFMNLFWDSVIDHGGEITALESYDPAQTDFADPLKKLVGLYYEVPEDLQPYEKRFRAIPTLTPKKHRHQPEEAELRPLIDFDALFIPDSPGKTGLIAPQLAYYDIKGVQLLGTNLWHSDTLIRMSRKFIQGAVFPQGFFLDSDSLTTINFIRRYQEAYGEIPGFIEAVVYDTTTVLLKILSTEGVTHRHLIKNSLLQLDNFKGATGLTAFDNDGNVRKNLYVLSIKGDRFVEVARDP